MMFVTRFPLSQEDLLITCLTSTVEPNSFVFHHFIIMKILFYRFSNLFKKLIISLIKKE